MALREDQRGGGDDERMDIEGLVDNGWNEDGDEDKSEDQEEEEVLVHDHVDERRDLRGRKERKKGLGPQYSKFSPSVDHWRREIATE